MQKTTVRGFAPGDAKEFGPRQTQTLRTALGDVAMLLDRGYAVCRAADFVGDRYQLSSRQRTALVRAACSKAALKGRAAREINGGLEGGELIIDGFNVIITLETALSGSTVLRCMDGTLRDLCGLRGTYRLIDKTGPAVELALSRMEVLGISSAVWVLDKPVSNSGRLAGLIREASQGRSFSTRVVLSERADTLVAQGKCAATSDSAILDTPVNWVNLASRAAGLIEGFAPFDLSSPC